MPDGWEAELYRNDQLIGYFQSRGDGRYEFLDVPLLYGQNRMEVVLYGPQGQIRREIKQMQVGIDSIPPQQTWYWAGFAQENADLIEFGKANAGRLVVGSTGIGTTAHLALEEILLQHGIRYVHVPYRGTADQMLDIASGQVMAGVNSTGFAPWVDQGSVRLLAVFGASRSPRWPEVPTLRELGYERAVYTSPWGLAVPRGVDEAVVAALHTAFHQAVFRPRHMAELARYDQQVEYLGTAAYRRAVQDTSEREARLLRRLNLLAPR